MSARSNAWACGLSLAEIVGSNPAGGMDVCLLKGLCDGLITRPEESYRLWCVVVYDVEMSRMMRPWPALGHSATKGGGRITHIKFRQDWFLYFTHRLSFMQ